ncbi:MAG: GGDEF domain-containing protein, partial [Alphaproteobacteria bacterium]|nr:GGDEF domain-containing protein [Alphaproteobacteria bacterium]
WELDARGCFTFVQGVEKILGYEPDEMIGRCYTEFLAPDPENGPGTAIGANKPFKNSLSRCRHKDGHDVWISSSGHPIHDANGHFVGYRGVDVDVNELTQARQELERIALHDPLTSLANRIKFMQRFDLECERQKRSGKPLSLIVVDIDHFKLVNDRFGHLAGDTCLRKVADVLSHGVRSVDVVARFGGEEFIILLPETDIGGATILAEKLRELVAESESRPEAGPDAPTLRVTISLGVACSHEPVPFDDLMERADTAVYKAKHAGRDRVCVAD